MLSIYLSIYLTNIHKGIEFVFVNNKYRGSTPGIHDMISFNTDTNDATELIQDNQKLNH